MKDSPTDPQGQIKLQISLNSVKEEPQALYNIQNLSYLELKKKLVKDFSKQSMTHSLFYIDQDGDQAAIDNEQTLNYCKSSFKSSKKFKSQDNKIKGFLKLDPKKIVKEKTIHLTILGPDNSQKQIQIKVFQNKKPITPLQQFLHHIYSSFGFACYKIIYRDDDEADNQFETEMKPSPELNERWEEMLETIDSSCYVKIQQVMPQKGSRKVRLLLPPQREKIIKVDQDTTYEEISGIIRDKFNKKYFQLVLDRYKGYPSRNVVLNEASWNNVKNLCYENSTFEIQDYLPVYLFNFKIQFMDKEFQYELNRNQLEKFDEFRTKCRQQFLPNHTINSFSYQEMGGKKIVDSEEKWQKFKETAKMGVIIKIQATKFKSSSSNSKNQPINSEEILNSPRQCKKKSPEIIREAELSEEDSKIWKQKTQQQAKKKFNQMVPEERFEPLREQMKKEKKKKKKKMGESEEDDDDDDDDEHRKLKMFEKFFGLFKETISTAISSKGKKVQESDDSDDEQCDKCEGQLSKTLYRKCKRCNQMKKTDQKKQSKRQNFGLREGNLKEIAQDVFYNMMIVHESEK